KLGLLTCWPGFQITPPTKSPTCCHGIGRRTWSPRPPWLPDDPQPRLPLPGVLTGCIPQSVDWLRLTVALRRQRSHVRIVSGAPTKSENLLNPRTLNVRSG